MHTFFCRVEIDKFEYSSKFAGEECKDYSDEYTYADCVDDELHQTYSDLLGCVPPWMSARNLIMIILIK